MVAGVVQINSEFLEILKCALVAHFKLAASTLFHADAFTCLQANIAYDHQSTLFFVLNALFQKLL